MKTHEEHMNSLTPERREVVETKAERIIQIAEAISKLEWLFEADRYPSYKEDWEIVKNAASGLCD